MIQKWSQSIANPAPLVEIATWFEGHLEENFDPGFFEMQYYFN
jgi:hypothetical protein